jgi:hypothetical protein
MLWTGAEAQKEDGTMGWTIVEDDAAYTMSMQLARGSYQRALLDGNENLSGSTLKGKAARYSGHYRASRQALLGRLTAAGVRWEERRGERGRRVLVLLGVDIGLAVSVPVGDSVQRLVGDQ